MSIAPAQVDVGSSARSSAALEQAAALLELALECLREGDPRSQIRRCITAAHAIVAGRPEGVTIQ